MQILNYKGCLIYVHADGRIYWDSMDNHGQVETVREAKRVINQLRRG